jgi:[ribosomal protein S18]-alanine N-acetyltransferase
MTLEDIPRVVEIDRESFPLPWSEATYRHELLQNKHSHFLVAIETSTNHNARQAGQRKSWLADVFGWLGQPQPRQPARSVVGYVGFWHVLDEAHISTIAVAAGWRRRGVGEQLLRAMLFSALEFGAITATLEVRVSNERAQNLYRKYAFEAVGRRRRYYRDNGEDALLMAVQMHPGYRQFLEHVQAAGHKEERR